MTLSNLPISRKKQGTADSNIYEGFFSEQQQLGASHYDSYFNSDSTKRLIPMEWKLLLDSVIPVVNSSNFSANRLRVLNFGAGNGRELPFYLKLADIFEQRTAPLTLELTLQDISYSGLVSARDKLLNFGLTASDDSHMEDFSNLPTLRKNNLSVRFVHSETSDTFEETAEKLGFFEIVHSMFGVLSSICDEDLIQETLIMLSYVCSQRALFTVASEGRFEDELQKYDKQRLAGEAPPSLLEAGTICYKSEHLNPDGTYEDYGSERYKVFSFRSLEEAFSNANWEIGQRLVVNTKPPMYLSQNWQEAIEDSQVCEAINERISNATGSDLGAYLAQLSKESMHIGLMCLPSV